MDYTTPPVDSGIIYQGLEYSPSPMFTLSTRPSSLVINGKNCTITISFDNGRVKLDGCDADTGAKEFWTAIERMYPGAIKLK